MRPDTSTDNCRGAEYTFQSNVSLLASWYMIGWVVPALVSSLSAAIQWNDQQSLNPLCFPSLHPALLTLYAPSFLLFVFCTSLIIHASSCTSSRRSAAVSRRQLRLDQVDSKLGLLSVPSMNNQSSVSMVDPPGRVWNAWRGGRQLLVMTVMMILGLLSWVSGAAAGVLERRTPSGTLAAGLYALCTSAIAILLVLLHSPVLLTRLTYSWISFGRNRDPEKPTGWGNVTDHYRTATQSRHQSCGNPTVYSITNSSKADFHICTAFGSHGDCDIECAAEVGGPGASLSMRDCTGSSCSLQAVSSAKQLPDECDECRFCRSCTDGSTGGRSLSRHSTRMNDFDDLSCCLSEDGTQDPGYLEGGWWNGEVDVDGCSIHLAPCPSPASACSTPDPEDDVSPSSPSPRRLTVASLTPATTKRRCTGVGASPVTSTSCPRQRSEPRALEEHKKHFKRRRQRKSRLRPTRTGRD